VLLIPLQWLNMLIPQSPTVGCVLLSFDGSRLSVSMELSTGNTTANVVLEAGSTSAMK